MRLPPALPYVFACVANHALSLFSVGVCAPQRLACCTLLLDAGADPNYGTGATAVDGSEARRDGGGATPLLAAVEAQHESLVALLLARGADPNLGASGGGGGGVRA